MANGAGSGLYPAVNNLSKEKGLAMLKGSRAGTYGGSMKSVMVPFVKGKTDQQLEALAAYMATLKK
jgi:cytochrome c553